MKAHIRKTPTLETYLEKLSSVMENVIANDNALTSSMMDKLNSIGDMLASEEYYEKMLEELKSDETVETE